jgi:hypothetical protein
MGISGDYCDRWLGIAECQRRYQDLPDILAESLMSLNQSECQNPVLKRRGMSILCYMCQTGWFTNAGRRRLEKLRRVLKPRMITILARNLL